MDNKYYKYLKYLKYKNKYLKLKNKIIGGEINKDYKWSQVNNSNVYVYKDENGNNWMKFNDPNTNIYQSYFNDNNLSYSYLGYTKYVINMLSELKFRSILFIGLGGGHLPRFMKKNFPSVFVDIVEIDKNVIDGSILLGLNENDFNIFNDDGTKFIKKSSYYDIVVLDLDGYNSFQNFSYEDLSKKCKYLIINCHYENSDFLNLYEKHKEKYKKYYNIVNEYINDTNVISLLENKTNY